jgi:hypothetical protein
MISAVSPHVSASTPHPVPKQSERSPPAKAAAAVQDTVHLSSQARAAAGNRDRADNHP